MQDMKGTYSTMMIIASIVYVATGSMLDGHRHIREVEMAKPTAQVPNLYCIIVPRLYSVKHWVPWLS